MRPQAKSQTGESRMMKHSWIPKGLVVATLALIALPARAHHAFAAEFDIARPLLLSGTVTKWELVNPHSWIHLDIPRDQLAICALHIEMDPRMRIDQFPFSNEIGRAHV